MEKDSANSCPLPKTIKIPDVDIVIVNVHIHIPNKNIEDMNVTTRWYWAQNAAKTKKAVDVIIVGASGTIVKTTVQSK